MSHTDEEKRKIKHFNEVFEIDGIPTGQAINTSVHQIAGAPAILAITFDDGSVWSKACGSNPQWVCEYRR